MNFGSGWTAANNWAGNYDKVGDLSNVADYANAHTYANLDQLPGDTLQRLNGLAHMAAASRPVITTEMGWNESQGFSQADIAKFTLDTVMDGIQAGDVKTYFYALFDDGSGQFGLMNQDGSAKPAGQALHNLTTLLADPGGAGFAAGSLDYSLSGTQAGDNQMLIEKSDGTFWLSLWNEGEAGGAHDVTLHLPAASEVKVFDPLLGTSALSDVGGATAATVSLPDHPVLVEIIPGSTATPTPTPTPVPVPTPTPTPTPTGATGPQDLGVVLPAAITVGQGVTTPIAGICIDDAWAATHPGTLALNVWDNAGVLGLGGQSGHALSLHGTLDQLNAALAQMTYAGSAAGQDAISVDVWNQAGVERLPGRCRSAWGAPRQPQPQPQRRHLPPRPPRCRLRLRT